MGPCVYSRMGYAGRYLLDQGQVVIDHLAIDGRPLYRLTLQGVFVNQYKLGSTATTLGQDAIDVVFKTVKLKQFTFGPEGKMRSASSLEWDVQTGAVN